VNGSFLSGGYRLERYLVAPIRPAEVGPPALLLCHGFPSGPLDARQSALTFPELCDRVAGSGVWAAMTFTFRGCGQSEGQFSALGWLADLKAAIDHLDEQVRPSSIFVVGASTGGSLALVTAADDPRISGIALLGARASFNEWIERPHKFLAHAREIGAIRDARFPAKVNTWASEFDKIRPLEAATRFAPRPLLVLHGSEDESVPSSDAWRFVEAHGLAEMRLVAGAGHRLRHDPRAIAVLLGWLDRSYLALRSES
jgi:uncharacterized protein